MEGALRLSERISENTEEVTQDKASLWEQSLFANFLLSNNLVATNEDDSRIGTNYVFSEKYL